MQLVDAVTHLNKSLSHENKALATALGQRDQLQADNVKYIDNEVVAPYPV